MVVSGLDETECVGKVQKILAVRMLLSSSSSPKPSIMVFNIFRITLIHLNSSAIFITLRPNYDIFIMNSVKTNFSSMLSFTFHIYAILNTPQSSLKTRRICSYNAHSAALLQKRVRRHGFFYYFIAELRARERSHIA